MPQAATAQTWILTGSRENFAATRVHDFKIIGMKERRLKQAQTMRPGDRIVFYLTKVQMFAAIVEIESGLFEQRDNKIWPGAPNKPDPYPWRFETKPLIVLDEDHYVPAEDLATRLEHVGKWPAEHWKLAFQGQLRTVSDADAALLEQELRVALAGACV